MLKGQITGVADAGPGHPRCKRGRVKGCRSSSSIVVTAVPVPSPAITQTGNTLSVPAVYATYQWYKGTTPISGATAASYNPTSNGTYCVRVTTSPGNCPGSSSAYTLSNLSVTAITALPLVRVFPNPVTDGVVYVAMEGLPVSQELAVSLYDATGRQLLSKTIRYTGSKHTAKLESGQIATGIYYLRIIAGGTSSLQRIVVYGE